MKDKDVTQIAVIQNDIEHIKESLDDIRLDLKEMTKAYVPFHDFEEEKKVVREKLTNTLSRDEFAPYKAVLLMVATAVVALVIDLLKNLIHLK